MSPSISATSCKPEFWICLRYSRCSPLSSVTFLKQLRVADNRGQRRPEFVRNGGQKLALDTVSPLEVAVFALEFGLITPQGALHAEQHTEVAQRDEMKRSLTDQ